MIRPTLPCRSCGKLFLSWQCKNGRGSIYWYTKCSACKWQDQKAHSTPEQRSARSWKWILAARAKGTYNNHGKIGTWLGYPPARAMYKKLTWSGVERDEARIEAVKIFNNRSK